MHALSHFRNSISIFFFCHVNLLLWSMLNPIRDQQQNDNRMKRKTQKVREREKEEIKINSAQRSVVAT